MNMAFWWKMWNTNPSLGHLVQYMAATLIEARHFGEKAPFLSYSHERLKIHLKNWRWIVISDYFYSSDWVFKLIGWSSSAFLKKNPVHIQCWRRRNDILSPGEAMATRPASNDYIAMRYRKWDRFCRCRGLDWERNSIHTWRQYDELHSGWSRHFREMPFEPSP